MGWLSLALAICSDVAGVVLLRLSDGLTRPLPTAAMVVCFVIAYVLLAIAVTTINLSVAYAVWAGLGTALVAVIGILAFAEPVTAAKVVFLALIIIGVVGLNVTGGGRA